MSKPIHRPAAPCTARVPRFVIRGRRCMVALKVGDQIAACETNNRKWRPNNWQRVMKDQRGEE